MSAERRCGTCDELRDMRDKILEWFATGQIGASSKAMAFAVVGLPSDGSRPHDPADFNRCLMLMNSVPEIREHMDRVANINSSWAALVSRWAEVEKCFLDEAGLGWCKEDRAPKTYALMQSIFYGTTCPTWEAREGSGE